MHERGPLYKRVQRSTLQDIDFKPSAAGQGIKLLMHGCMASCELNCQASRCQPTTLPLLPGRGRHGTSQGQLSIVCCGASTVYGIPDFLFCLLQRAVPSMCTCGKSTSEEQYLEPTHSINVHGH